MLIGATDGVAGRLRCLTKRDRSARSVLHVSLTLSVMIVGSCGLVFDAPTRCSANKPFSRITGRTRRGLARLCAGGYALPVPRPRMRRPNQVDRRSCSAARESDRRWRARFFTLTRRAPDRNIEPRWARVLLIVSTRVPSSASILDLTHLGFQPGDLVVAVIAFFQGCRGASSAAPWRVMDGRTSFLNADADVFSVSQVAAFLQRGGHLQ
jgi:hypothetical protein